MFGKRTQVILRDVEDAKLFFESLLAPITSGVEHATALRAEATQVENAVKGLRDSIKEFAQKVNGGEKDGTTSTTESS